MKFRQFLVTLFCCCIWILGILPAQAVNQNLEQTVLEIIEQHPETILKSLADYQRQQQENQKQAQEQAIAQAQNQLDQVVRHSPSVSHSQHPKATLIEFADFECPFCIQAYPELKKFLAQHPDVIFVFKQLPLVDLHPDSLPAAKAAWAAGQQGQFWQFHDALFERKGDLRERLYQKIATRLNLDLEQFERDRHSFAATQAIAQDVQLANRLKIEGTPSFLALTSQEVELISGADFAALTKIVSRVTTAPTRDATYWDVHAATSPTPIPG